MSGLHDDVPWPVRTERLVLRPATPCDADALYAIRSAPGVDEWLTSSWRDRDDFQANYVDTERYERVVVVELDGPAGAAVIGELMIAIQDGWGQREVQDRAAGVEAELGWVVTPEHGGHGYATEAVRAAVDICFHHLGLRRVFAGCFAENEASWRLMERIGMRRESASRRDGLHRTRGWMDGYTYALLAEEWPS